ncbi:MAG: thermonuclease family protein [Verrucomicrobiota bacterium]
MKRGKGRRSPFFIVLLIVVAAVFWLKDFHRAEGTSAAEKPPRAIPVENAEPPGDRPTRKTAGAYELYERCTLVGDRGNDGDSFRVRLPDGRVETFRLYFVDAPESAFRRYRGGETNHARIRDQAADLGGITPQQAVAMGKKAKEFSLGLLKSAPFTIFTRWDSPFHDRRYHAFVLVESGGRKRLLHELLVERGLCRIRTKPGALPDGTPPEKQRKKLREMERAARKAETGVWGM